MTSPLQQKLQDHRAGGRHRQPARRRRRGLPHRPTATGRPASNRPPWRARRRPPANCWRPRRPTTSARSAPMSRRSSCGPTASVRPGNLRERIRSPARPSICRSRSESEPCTSTTISTARWSTERVAEFRDQVARRLSRRTDRGRIQAAAADERRLSAAARLHAADRDSLRHAVVRPAAHARACRAPLRSRLRPFHHAAEHPVQLDQARGVAGRHGRPRARRPARHADQRQLRAQRHDRPMGRRRARRDRGPAHLGGNPAPALDDASGILVPAAQVQDRGHGVRARPRRDQGARHRAAAASQRRRRDRLRGDGRRRARPHAVHRQDHQAVPAQARSAELCRGDPARLQPVRPARQHLQGAHQDPGARARRRGIRQGGRGRMAGDQGRRAGARSGADRRHRRALPLSATTSSSTTIRPSWRAARAADRALRRLARQFGRQPQGAGLRHRHAVAQAGRRAARRRHRRADGRDRRSRRPLFVRRDPRRPRAESGAAACRAARSAGAVARARRDRRRDAECRARLRHHRLSGARLLQPRQYALDPGRAGADAALPRSRRSRATSAGCTSTFPAASMPAAIITSAISAFSASRRTARSSTRSRSAAAPTSRPSSARCSGRRCPMREVADVVEDIVAAYLELRERPDEFFIDTVKRIGVEPFKERVYATR